MGHFGGGSPCSDTTTGTYQYGSRHYDPTTATWATPDTARPGAPITDHSIGTDPLTQNRYTYVNGDPINLTDPSGHHPCQGVEYGARDACYKAYAERMDERGDPESAEWARERARSIKLANALPVGGPSAPSVREVVLNALPDLGLVGACAHGSATVDADVPDGMLAGIPAGGNVGVQGCAVWADMTLEGIAFTGTIDFGGGVQLGGLFGATMDDGPLSAEAGVGLLLSNVDEVSQLEGRSVCVSVTYGGRYGFGGVGCVGQHPDGTLTEAVTFYPHLQIRSSPGMEVTVTTARSEYVTALDVAVDIEGGMRAYADFMNEGGVGEWSADRFGDVWDWLYNPPESYEVAPGPYHGGGNAPPMA